MRTPQAAGGEQAAVVAGGDDFVTPADDLGSNRQPAGFDLAGGDPVGPGPQGQSVHGGVIRRHDHDRFASGASGTPGGEGLIDHLLPVAASDPAVGGVVVEDGVVSLTQPQSRFSFPGVGEAADLVEFGGAAVGDQEAEQAAGFDGAELAVIPDQDEFGVGGFHRFDQGGEVRGGQHGGLVDDHDLTPAELGGGITALAAPVEELGDRLGGNPGFFGQHPSRHGRNGQASQLGPVVRPGVPSGAKH